MMPLILPRIPFTELIWGEKNTDKRMLDQLITEMWLKKYIKFFDP